MNPHISGVPFTGTEAGLPKPALVEPPMPEHDKFRPHQEDANTIGEFIEWLQSQGVHLMVWSEVETEIPCWRCSGVNKECGICQGKGFSVSSREDWTAYGKTIQEIIALFFSIDKKKFDDETEALYRVVSKAANARHT